MSYLFNPVAGYAGRLKWWLSQLLIMVILVVGIIAIGLTSIDADPNTLEQNPEFVGKIWPLMILTGYINLCACLNRLRDSGRSGWWYLTHFIPFVGPFIIIYFCGIEKGSSRISTDVFSDMGSGLDPDELIRRYQSGHSPASQYTPPASKPTQAAPNRPQIAMQSPKGFGKRRGFQGNWS